MTTRRAQLAALGLAGIAAPFAAAGTAHADPSSATVPAGPLHITATRTKITLPVAPPLGTTYIVTFDLTDAAGGAAGTAWSSSSVVDVGVGGPVVFGMIILSLADGELHYQRVINRFGTYPYTSTGAILGGTGTYSTATGTVDVAWPDADTINLTIHLG